MKDTEKERDGWRRVGREHGGGGGEREGVREGAALPREGGHSRNAVNCISGCLVFVAEKSNKVSSVLYH